MPRIAPITALSPEQEEALAKTLRAPGGEALNLFATLARSPQMLRRVNALGGYFMAHGSLPLRTRELVILRVAGTVGCGYEAEQHRWISGQAEIEPAVVEAALDPSLDHRWEPEDAAVLALTDELLASDSVADEVWEAARASFDEDQCVELLLLPGFYRMLAGVLNGLEVELDPFLTEAAA